MTIADRPTLEPQRGRTRVTPRALSRVVSAVTADTLGVQAKHVNVELHDERGVLAVSISTRIPVRALKQTQDDEPIPGQNESLLDRVVQARQIVRGRITTLTGSQLGAITLRFTGATTQRERGVR